MDLLPIHYKFRFTFSEQDKTHEYADQIPRWKVITKNLIDKLLNLYKITALTGGVETLNKDGERTWCHCHIHFDAIENKETILRAIKRYLVDTYDQTAVGVKCISLKPEAMLRSYDEFYRYPLKQSLNKKLCYGFDDTRLDHMHEVAKDCYLKVQQVRQAKLDKSDNSDTLFERLILYLDKTSLEKNDTSKLSLLISATRFYVEENKPLQRNTIQGYVDNYMLKKQLITYEQYWK
jgi:hypothetical protein